jgi:Holliday junction resolvasome RuvABC DNA-binding subunit
MTLLTNYKNELQSEESIAELFGILAENYESSPQSVKDLINDWIRKLAKILNVPVEGILDSDKQVLEFLDVVSGKVARGEVIEQIDIELLQEQEQGSEAEVKIPETRQQRTTRLAPNGNQSNLTDVQYDIVRTPAFKNWFGDWENNPKNASKVIDDNGEPLVVYHGTPSVDIDIFDREKSKRRDSGLKEFGTYFATNKNLAELYKQGDGRIYPIFLNIRDMVTFDANKETNIEAWNNLKVKASYKTATNRDAMEFLSPVVSKKKNLDRFGVEPVNGIKAENIIDMSIGSDSKQSEQYKKAEKEYLGDVYLLFDGQPENAKLADGTNTTFDPDAPSIRQQEAQDDFTIQDVIEDAEQEGLTRKETIEVLQELGFTKDEIRSAMKPVKEKARSVASETTGLSPREAFKQGFTEFFDAIQRGKKEARQKAAENLKEKLNKVRESFKKKLQKEKDNKTARAAVVKEIRAIIKDSGISQFSKRTINKIMTNVKNTNVSNMQRMVDEVMDVVNRDIDRKVRAARYKTLKAAINKLSRLGALKELQKPLMEVLSINPDYLSKTALNFYDRVVINLANVEKKFDSRDSREDLKNAAEEVIRRFTIDNIRAEQLAEETINPNLDLTKTKGENLKQMLKDGLISDSDFELMTRFEDLIGSTTKEGLTLEELEQKAKERRDNAIEDFEAAMDEIPSSLPNLSRDDAEAVRFANGLKMKDLESLSTAQIKMLTRGLEMLQAGFVTTNLVQSKIRC